MRINQVVVTGIGLQSCLGDLKQSWEQLLMGKSGIKIAQPYPELPSYPLGLIGEKPQKFSQLTAKILKEAIADAALELPLKDCGVVIGSSRGSQAQWEEILSDAAKFNSKINWWETLPQQGSILTARKISSEGPVLAPMAACATGIWAIAQGFELIQQGHCQRVIAGAVETPITPLTLASFDRMNALAKDGCYPFDLNRNGLTLAEGGAIFILENAKLAHSRKAFIYGQVLGFAASCDAHHLNAPEATGKTAIYAIKQCLNHSYLSSQDIDYIHAHGTGTILNDAREATIINSVFGDKIKVSSTKGATGHTLGASGALGAAFGLMAIQTQQLPPCVGLSITEFNLNLVAKSERYNLDNLLCFSFGFGGQNAILALGNYDK